MSIDIRMVRNQADSEAYIQLPYQLYKNWKPYVPPLIKDERKFHDPRHQGALSICDTVRFLAFSNGTLVGRIMGIIPHEYNQQLGLSDCRFFQLDCTDDPNVAHLLLDAVANWGSALGMKQIVGPFGFSDKDPQGLQIEGDHLQPVIASAIHPPYLRTFVESHGFTKFKDCINFMVPLPLKLPDIYQNVFDRLTRSQYRVVPATSRRSIKKYFKDVYLLLNAGYENLYGFVSMTEEDIQQMADEYLGMIDPGFVKFVEYVPTKSIVGFVVAMPNLSTGLRRANGHLWPWGFLHILKDLKHSKKLDLLLGAIHPNHQGKGLSAMMAIELTRSAEQKGMRTLDSHLILEENKLMCAEMKRLGAQAVKRYRIYSKPI